jgi:hypothetical protein
MIRMIVRKLDSNYPDSHSRQRCLPILLANITPNGAFQAQIETPSRVHRGGTDPASFKDTARGGTDPASFKDTARGAAVSSSCYSFSISSSTLRRVLVTGCRGTPANVNPIAAGVGEKNYPKTPSSIGAPFSPQLNYPLSIGQDDLVHAWPLLTIQSGCMASHVREVISESLGVAG